MNTTVENPFAPSGDFSNPFRAQQLRKPKVTPSGQTSGSMPWLPGNKVNANTGFVGGASFDLGPRPPRPYTSLANLLPGYVKGQGVGEQYRALSHSIYSGTTRNPDPRNEVGGWLFGANGQRIKASPNPAGSAVPGSPSPTYRGQVMRTLQQENAGGKSPLDRGKIAAGLMPDYAGYAPHQNADINALLEGAGYSFNEGTQQWGGMDWMDIPQYGPGTA
jgi:hypothetical protein